MANKEIKKKEAEDLFKALSLGTLRDDTKRIEGSYRNPRWKRPDKKGQRKANGHQNIVQSQ